MKASEMIEEKIEYYENNPKGLTDEGRSLTRDFNMFLESLQFEVERADSKLSFHRVKQEKEILLLQELAMEVDHNLVKDPRFNEYEQLSI